MPYSSFSGATDRVRAAGGGRRSRPRAARALAVRDAGGSGFSQTLHRPLGCGAAPSGLRRT